MLWWRPQGWNTGWHNQNKLVKLGFVSSGCSAVGTHGKTTKKLRERTSSQGLLLEIKYCQYSILKWFIDQKHKYSLILTPEVGQFTDCLSLISLLIKYLQVNRLLIRHIRTPEDTTLRSWKCFNLFNTVDFEMNPKLIIRCSLGKMITDDLW